MGEGRALGKRRTKGAGLTPVKERSENGDHGSCADRDERPMPLEAVVHEAQAEE